MKNLSVCVDANIAINFLIAGPFNVHATVAMEHWMQTRTTLLVPTLFDYEVVSALRRAVHMKQINKGAGEDAFQRYLQLPLSRQHNGQLLNRSWEIANRFDRSRIYDASYLAVASLNDCELWTADQRLYNAVHKHLSWVRWIEEI